MIQKDKNIEFWFSIGSTYTYLTVRRIRKVIKESNLSIKFQPFNVRTVMLEMENIPFPKSKKIKVDHMWRDIQRRAEFYNMDIPELPISYPLKNMDLANHIALVGIKEGWCLDYLELTYYNWFINKQPAGEEENLINTFKKLNLDYEVIKNKANADDIKNNLIEQTNLAISKGVFGSPTFITEKEIFWGDDRLEDTIKWQNK
ncbi:MAG: DsbA family protein [Alphaproteobacteria bacterium]